MTGRMKRIVVTPAGRRKYLEPLWKHLLSQRSSFDEWHLWVNTVDEDDLRFMRSIASEHVPGGNPIRLVDAPGSQPREGVHNIHRFFPGCTDPGAVYLRLDDDVVWLSPGFVSGMFSRRESDCRSFLISGNVVNNAVCSHLVSKGSGVIPPCGPSADDPVGWGDAAYAEGVHRAFLSSLSRGSIDEWLVDDHVMPPACRISINAVSWRGDAFSRFAGAVGVDEEAWLTVFAPAWCGPVVVDGGALCVHFAFGVQRDRLDSTDLLDRYNELADKLPV